MHIASIGKRDVPFGRGLTLRLRSTRAPNSGGNPSPADRNLAPSTSESPAIVRLASLREGKTETLDAKADYLIEAESELSS